jgi:SSS family solute:Na+ symporter
MAKRSRTWLVVLLGLSWDGLAQKPTLEAFPGTTPVLDGRIQAGEWDDAVSFSGVRNWVHTFTPTRSDKDLSLKGWVKHDGRRLYFAFDVTDDVLYAFDVPRWLSKENPNAHEMSPRGWPWFGDEMELLINATNRFTGNENAAGNGGSWQMVCHATKSRLGGLGRGGLMEGEPRSDIEAYRRYRAWIESGAQECAVAMKPGGKGYQIEWAVRFDPCLEVEPGRFYSVEMGDRAMGLNIALGDLDEPEKGAGNFGNFHHEEWWAGTPKERTQLRHWGTLWIRTSPRKRR